MPSELLHIPSELLQQVASGDPDAFAELHRRFWQEAFSLALTFLRTADQAEDVVQEVFVKLWLKRETLPTIHEFTPYFMVMVRNEIINYLRKLAKQRSNHAQFMAEQQPALLQPQPMSDTDTAALVAQALDELTERQLTIFNLSREEGLSHEAIAEKLGISKKTVSNTITQVLNHLRTTLYQRGLISLFTLLLLKK